MPIERAEPAIICAAASISLAFRSFIFALAISRTCAIVTWPTKSRPGAFEPSVSFVAFFRKNEAGGVFISNKSSALDQAASWQFVSYLMNTQSVATWAAGTGYIPVRKSSAQTATVHRVGENRYRGSFHNVEYDISGTIFVVVSGNSQSVRLTSTSGSALFRLSR